MCNDLFTIGSFTIHGYGLMTAIGIIVAYILMEVRAKRKGLDADRVFWLLIWCLIFGYIGSKILYFITILPSIIQDPSRILASLADGWVMYGGLIGGMVGGYLYCRYKKINAWAYFDLGFVSVIIAQAFGRIGCFLAGCCYGIETDASYAITFTNSDFAPNNVPLFPTQLLMSAGDFLLFALLIIYDRYKKSEGMVTGLYLMLYSAGRFAVEFVRGDVARGSVGPLSTSQFIAIFIFCIGLVIFILRRRHVDTEIPEAAEGEEKPDEAGNSEAEQKPEEAEDSVSEQEAEAETETEQQTETEAEAETEQQTETEAEAETEQQTETEAEAETEQKSEDSESEQKAEAEAQDEQKTEAEEEKENKE